VSWELWELCKTFPESEELVRIPTGEVVPRLIGAVLTDESQQQAAALRVAVADDGRAVCYGITSLAWDGSPAGHRWVHDVITDLPAGMNLKEWTRYIVVQAATVLRTGKHESNWPEMPSSMTRKSLELDFWADVSDRWMAQKIKRRTATTPDRLREVARLYRGAVQDGRSTRKAVAAAMTVSESQAAKLISQARQQGFLGAAAPRRVGEIDA
jgi:hypothetical protein